MKIIQSLLVSAVFAAGGLTALSTIAQTKSDTASDAKSATSKDMTEGEIRKIDKDAGKVTIKHSEIKNLSMPGMTMVFQVKDKAILDNVKTGDKIKFTVVNNDGNMVVTEIRPDK